MKRDRTGCVTPPRERTAEIERLRRILKTIAENSTTGHLHGAEAGTRYVVTDHAYVMGKSAAGNAVITELLKYMDLTGERDG